MVTYGELAKERDRGTRRALKSWIPVTWPRETPCSDLRNAASLYVNGGKKRDGKDTMEVRDS